MVPREGQRLQRDRRGTGRDDPLRRSLGYGSTERLQGGGHDQSTVDRRRVPAGHAVQRYQRDTHVRSGNIPEQRQHAVTGKVHDAGRRDAGDRVRCRIVHGQPCRP